MVTIMSLRLTVLILIGSSLVLLILSIGTKTSVALTDNAPINTGENQTAADLQCYTCTSYMNECKKSVDNLNGHVSTTPCASKCFSRRGEDDAIYRGCFDGFVGIPDLKHDFIGCASQMWNRRNLMWCFCETSLCNGEYIHPAKSKPRPVLKETSKHEIVPPNNDGGQDGGVQDGGVHRRFQNDGATIYDNDVSSGDPKRDMLSAKGKLSYVIVSDRVNHRSPSAEINQGSLDNSLHYKEGSSNDADSTTPTVVHNVSETRNRKSDELKTEQTENNFTERSRIADEHPLDKVAESHGNDVGLDQLPDYYELQKTRNGLQGEFWEENNVAVFDPSGSVVNGREVSEVHDKKSDTNEVGDIVSKTAPVETDLKKGVDIVNYPTTELPRIPQLDCIQTGYFQNRFDCTTYIACLLDPALQIPVVHVMSCPHGLYWDDNYKICLEYSNTCKDGDSYYKQIYNHRYLLLHPPRSQSPTSHTPNRKFEGDDLTSHKYSDNLDDEIGLKNDRVKLQHGRHGDARNYFKNGLGDADEQPRESMVESVRPGNVPNIHEVYTRYESHSPASASSAGIPNSAYAALSARMENVESFDINEKMKQLEIISQSRSESEDNVRNSVRHENQERASNLRGNVRQRGRYNLSEEVHVLYS